jgi:preprotein translocase subunit SecG
LTSPGDDLQTERASEARKRTGDALLQRCNNTAFLAFFFFFLSLVLTTLSTPVLW